MSEKLIINFEEYLKTVEKLAIQINQTFDPTVLVGVMSGAAPIIDILSRIYKLPTAYIVIQSYSGEGMEDKQGNLVFARDISSIARNKDFERVLLVDDLSDTGLTLNRSIDWLKNYKPIKNFIKLSEELSKKYKCKFYLAAGKNDIDLINKFKNSSVGKNCESFEDLSIKETLPIIKNCNLTIANDTGFAHISAALGVKTLTLFMDSPILSYGR